MNRPQRNAAPIDAPDVAPPQALEGRAVTLARTSGRLEPDRKTLKRWAHHHKGWLTMDATTTTTLR